MPTRSFYMPLPKGMKFILPHPQPVMSRTMASAHSTLLYMIEDPKQRVMVCCATDGSRLRMKESFTIASHYWEQPLDWFEPHRFRLRNGAECFLSVMNEARGEHPTSVFISSATPAPAHTSAPEGADPALDASTVL